MDNQDLLLGIEEAKKGNYGKAAGYLAKVVQSDPMNVDGWLFLGHCLPDVEKRKYCYQRVLAIDPQNEIAKASLARLEAPRKLEPPAAENISPDLSRESPAPAPVSDQQTEAKPSTKRGGILGALVFGFILALILFALPVALLVMGGKFDEFLMGRYLAPGLFTQMEAATPGPLRNQEDIDFYISKARGLMEESDYANAILYLDKVIEFSPESTIAYAMRAKCYYQLNTNENSLDIYNSNLLKSLADIDKAISLQPSLDAEYYVLRRDDLTSFAGNLPYQVDREYIYNLAIDNDRTFLSLSPSLDRRLRIEAILASDLISTGQCKEGMELVKGLEKKIRPGDVGKYGCLMCAAASGYACLGDMDKAVESMDKLLAKSNDFVRTRTYLKALYLYQAGKKEEALTALNASINADPTFIGDRYYLRSLIYLERGDRQQAIDDLGMGERYTWDRYGLYAYVNAKLALEDGNKEDAIYWLQIAEASLFPESSMLKKQIQEELSQLGAKPLDRVVTIDFQGTPMPPVTPIP